MAGILFSPGQDPFSAFGRGYETSIANLLAMEREQRQKDEDAWVKKQRAGYDTAADSIAQANTDPRFFSTDPSVVQGGNLDALARSSGAAPADEWGTDTAGMAGRAMRAPQTYSEMGIKPGAAIQMEKWFPQARQTLGILTPQQQIQQQKEQAAIAKKQQLLLHPPTREEDVVPWIGQYSAVDGQASEKMIGYMIDKATQNPASVQKVIGLYSQKYQEGIQKGLSPTAAMDQAKQGILQGVSSGELSMGATTQAEGIIKPLEPRSETPGTQGLADVNKVMQQYPIVETPESVTDIYQKLMRIGTKPAMDEAAKLRPRITELVKEAHPTMANIPDNVIYGIANGDLPPIKLSDGTVFGKDQAARLKSSKIQVAGAAAQTRGESYGSGRFSDFLDTTKGNAPVSMSYGAMSAANEAEPGRFIPASSGGKALLSQARIGEVSGTISDTRAALKRLPDKDMFSREQAAQVALVLKDRDPHSALSAFMGSEVGRTLSNEQIDYVTALLSLRESAMMMVGQLGGGRATDVLRGAIGAMSPGATTPSKSYASRQLDLLQTELDRLKAGVPTVNVPKVPTPTPTGVAPAPSGKMVQVGGDTLPDPTGLKDGRRAGPYVIRNGQWVKE